MPSLHRNFIVAFAFACVVSAGSVARAAQAYAIIDSQTGYLLEEHEGKAKRQVGSLTKIATAIVVLDWADAHRGDLNQVATIPPEAFAGTGENGIGFQPGDRVTLRDLLYAALVQSDNVAAFTLADHVGLALGGGATPNSKITPVVSFVAQMNALAKQLRMERTRFLNPHGIDDHERPIPFSTAIDMARLTHYASKKASFRFYVSQRERQITFDRAGQHLGYLLRNTNELLGSNGIDGVKTGRTARAGDCLILSAHRESEIVKQGEAVTVMPRHLIVVMLGSPDRFGEGSQLLARGWSLYDQWAATGRMVSADRVL